VRWRGEKGHRGLSGHLSAPLSQRGARVGGGFPTFSSCACGLLTFRLAAELTHSCCLFGSARPFSCSPAFEGTRSCQAMAGHRMVLLRSLLTVGSQPWAWDGPNCPSSLPHSSWPSHAAPASGPMPAARHSQPHPHPICPDVPTLDSRLLGWLAVISPMGTLREARGAMVVPTLHGPGLTSPGSCIPGKKPLFWSRLLGPGIGLARHGARAPGAHASLLQRGGEFAAFPWFSRSELTFGSPSQLTVSK